MYYKLKQQLSSYFLMDLVQTGKGYICIGLEYVNEK